MPNQIYLLMRAVITAIVMSLFMIPAASAWAQDAAPSGRYELDSNHGYITFTYSHLGFSHPVVSFDNFTVDFDFNADKPEASTVEVVIDATSSDSGVDVFDEHLQGENFFNTANHTEIEFVSTGVKRTGDMTAVMTGDLTIKGITKPVSLDVKLNKAGPHPRSGKPIMGFDATTMVKRSDWGLERGAPAVSDEVTINISVELRKAE